MCQISVESNDQVLRYWALKSDMSISVRQRERERLRETDIQRYKAPPRLESKKLFYLFYSSARLSPSFVRLELNWIWLSSARLVVWMYQARLVKDWQVLAILSLWTVKSLSEINTRTFRVTFQYISSNTTFQYISVLLHFSTFYISVFR